MAERRIVALVGATGSGKSAVAMAAAGEGGIEIVAVDAFTVYRGMDIGTAKPPVADRRRVAHHMVDVLDPAQPCSVEWFQASARAAIEGVHATGRTPLLVGGSGLYFRAVVDALEFPPTDAAVRAQVAARYEHDPAQAYRDLHAVDPAAAQRMDPANTRRAVRALEVIELTGRPFSDWRRAWNSYESIYPNLRVVGVASDREARAQSLNNRVDTMMEAGWLDEALRLASSELSVTARQAIGYAELFEHLEGRIPLTEAVERIKARTRQYAARQDRWFRADPRVEWTSADQAPDLVRSLCTS